jgi:hypothetical protein
MRDVLIPVCNLRLRPIILSKLLETEHIFSGESALTLPTHSQRRSATLSLPVCAKIHFISQGGARLNP